MIRKTLLAAAAAIALGAGLLSPVTPASSAATSPVLPMFETVADAKAVLSCPLKTGYIGRPVEHGDGRLAFSDYRLTTVNGYLNSAYVQQYNDTQFAGKPYTRAQLYKSQQNLSAAYTAKMCRASDWTQYAKSAWARGAKSQRIDPATGTLKWGYWVEDVNVPQYVPPAWTYSRTCGWVGVTYYYC